MSNKDKILNMSTWDLAEFIYNVSNNAIDITTCKDECGKCDFSDDYCIYQIAEWLNAKVEDGNARTNDNV